MLTVLLSTSLDRNVEGIQLLENLLAVPYFEKPNTLAYYRSYRSKTLITHRNKK